MFYIFFLAKELEVKKDIQTTGVDLFCTVAIRGDTCTEKSG